LDNKVILITGGTGSFGNAFVEKLFKVAKPKKIIIFSRDEFKQHQMQQKFASKLNVLRFFIGDVRDKERLTRAFNGVDVVVHAAALKQVPALEYNPFEAVKTNIVGTQNLIDAAIDTKIKKVVFVSTDKAVNPINLYGATKLCAEKIVISANAYSAGVTRLSVVRYGNVIGSRGSIVEVLQKQKETGLITLTDERMTRFWFSLDEATDLVLQGLDTMKGGEIFIPKIPSMKVTDLITAIAPTAKVKRIGIRPGEKLHEALMTDEEVSRALDFKNTYVIQPRFENWDAKHLKGAKKVNLEFRYTSDANMLWLSDKELQKIASI